MDIQEATKKLEEFKDKPADGWCPLVERDCVGKSCRLYRNAYIRKMDNISAYPQPDDYTVVYPYCILDKYLLW
jgi:hypothetical protein